MGPPVNFCLFSEHLTWEHLCTAAFDGTDKMRRHDFFGKGEAVKDWNRGGLSIRKNAPCRSSIKTLYCKNF